jgi:hypothetical protein
MFYDNRFMKRQAQRDGQHCRSGDVDNIGFPDELK